MESNGCSTLALTDGFALLRHRLRAPRLQLPTLAGPHRHLPLCVQEPVPRPLRQLPDPSTPQPEMSPCSIVRGNSVGHARWLFVVMSAPLEVCESNRLHLHPEGATRWTQRREWCTMARSLANVTPDEGPAMMPRPLVDLKTESLDPDSG